MALIRASLFSTTLLQTVNVDVAIPQDQGRSLPAGPLPVLWLLHGEGGDQGSWGRDAPIESLSARAGIAIAMPAGENGFWTNMRYGFRWFDYLTEELPRTLGEMLPLSPRREDNAIAGVGMGAYGALKAGLACPGRYGAVGCFSGGNLPAGPAPAALPPGATEAMARTAPRLCFGLDGASPYDLPEALARQDDPFWLAGRFAAGSSAPGAPAVGNDGGADDGPGRAPNAGRLGDAPRIWLSTGTADPFIENFRRTRDSLASVAGDPFRLAARETRGGRDSETLWAALRDFTAFAFPNR